MIGKVRGPVEEIRYWERIRLGSENEFVLRWVGHETRR